MNKRTNELTNKQTQKQKHPESRFAIENAKKTNTKQKQTEIKKH